MRPIHRQPRASWPGRLPAGLVAAALWLPTGASAQQPAPTRTADAPLDEIVVTARMVEEDITRVPMSVQALSGEYLEQRDLSNLYDLQYAVPGLVLTNRGMFGAGISLRGVADEGGGSLSVAPHLNGVYLGRSTLALARQFDLERVEVVKGPQGTLYGRNATGGAINVITRTPEPELSAALEGAWGSFETARIGGHVNLPGDTVAARVAFSAADGDGFIRNSVDARRFAEDDYYAIRASVRVTPSDTLTIDAMVQHARDDGASGELWLPRPDRLPDPGDIHLTTVTIDDPYLETTNDFANVNVAYRFAGMTFRSISGYARNLNRDVDDCAGIAELAGCVRSVQPLIYEQFSQEFRLEAHAGESLDWIAGAYYFDGTETQNLVQRLAFSPGPVQDYRNVADESAFAGFGDATFRLGQHWRMNGGLRWSREGGRISYTDNRAPGPPTPRIADGSWDSTSWRLGVDYSPHDRLLFYANVATGFKSGGVTSTLLPTGEFDDYAPERITAYELGMSAGLREGRTSLRASAFAYDFKDLQVTTVDLIDGVARVVVDNAAAARIEGVDVSASTRIGEHFTLATAFVWLPRREFVEFIDERGNSLAGNDVTRASEWSASTSIGYRLPIAGRGELGVDVDYNFRSAFFFTKDNNRIQYQEDFGLLNLTLRFDAAQGGWYAFASARNLLDTDYFTQILFQSAPGYPTRYEVGGGWRY
jgi:iron complex outermembrane recepter protein